ncbi:MAG: hypothetical protein R3F56_12085 [Planctomycetota bacterium]
MRSLILASVLLAACATTTPRAPAPASQSNDAGRAWNARLPQPVTMPTIFEGPVVEGSVRPMVIYQRLPETSIFGGGDFQVYALQLRVPITDRLGFIATKDGYIDLNPGNGGDQEGFADVAAGLKYAVIQDAENGLIVTPGFVFEADVGNHDVFQGNGDGLLRMFVAAGLERERFNFLANVGYNLPMDGAAESHSIDYHAHVSYEAHANVQPLVELHGITYTRDGGALPVNFEGGDLINLGATNVSGRTVVTGAVGARFPINPTVSLGVAYEFPIGSPHDLLKDRVTLDGVISF